MSNFIDNSYSHVVALYGKCMHLKIYVENPELKQLYINASIIHNSKLSPGEHIDAGFDLFSPNEETNFEKSIYKLNFEIKCSAVMISETHRFNTGYYMYPRSSLSKICTGHQKN